MKWLNYADTENTWEPMANLNCPELLREFFDSMVQYISGVKWLENQPQYIMMFKNPEVLCSNYVRERFSEMVYDFYEEHLEWVHTNGLIAPNMRILRNVSIDLEPPVRISCKKLNEKNSKLFSAKSIIFKL